MEEMKPREPDLEQRVLGVGGQDETADYVRACQKEFRSCLRQIFLSVAQKAFSQEASIARKVMPDATKCYQDYFQSMKGQINLTEEDLMSLVSKEEERQQRFYRALRELSGKFSREGVMFEILSPGDIYCIPAWDTGLVVGTSIRTESGAYLFSSSPVPAHTTDYMALRQEPVAASIVAISKDFILFLPVNQVPGDKFREVHLRIFGREKDFTKEINGIWRATLMSGFLLLDSERTFSAAEIEELKRKYGVDTIVTANSSQFTAAINIEEDKEFSRLFQEISREEPY
jgi:hypothetical protein